MGKQYENPSVDLAQLFEERGVKFKENSTGELILDSCYECGKSKKMYVQKETGQHICFRCGAKGNATLLLAKVLDVSFKESAKILYGKGGGPKAATISQMKKEAEEESEDLNLDLMGLKKTSAVKDLELPKAIILSKDFKVLTKDFPEPYNYLLNRGYTEEDIEKLKLFVLPFKTFSDAWQNVEKRFKDEGLSGDKLKQEVKQIAKYQGRIVFPVYVESQIMGLVARDYTGEKDPKVLNSEGSFRSLTFWNYDNAKNNDTLVICEGNSSAVKCGVDRSIALLGKVATPNQLRLIKKMKAKKVVICLDIGTDKEQQALYQSLSLTYAGNIYRVSFPPVIASKDTLSESLISEVNSLMGTKLVKLTDNLLEAEPLNKEQIFRTCKINPKWTTGEKTAALSKYLTTKGASLEVLNFLKWFCFKAEYKDAGDYTHGEMEEFIQKAEKYRPSII